MPIVIKAGDSPEEVLTVLAPVMLKSAIFRPARTQRSYSPTPAHARNAIHAHRNQSRGRRSVAGPLETAGRGGSCLAGIVGTMS